MICPDAAGGHCFTSTRSWLRSGAPEKGGEGMEGKKGKGGERVREGESLQFLKRSVVLRRKTTQNKQFGVPRFRGANSQNF